MAIEFSPEQEKVIQLQNRNILVSAAAGSGKTAVLVERIVRMVCDEAHPVDIDRLLVVTFTNAAAAEMRERIDAGLAAQLKAHPDSEHIQRQTALLHNAQICTIDSFCLFLLRNHFHEIGLDPAFRVADENEVKLLKQDVLANLMEEAFAGRDPAFLRCVEFFCPKGRESVLENHILWLSEQAASGPFPEKWLREHKADYGAARDGIVLQEDVQTYLMHYLREMLKGLADQMEAAQRLCEQPDGPYMYGELIEQEREQILWALQAASYEEYAARIPGISFGRLPSKKDDSVDPAKRALAQEIRNAVKKEIADLLADFFAASMTVTAERAKGCADALDTLIELVIAFDARVREEKAQKKLVDFSDMEHLALEILLGAEGDPDRPGKVAEEYRDFFHEILIDEYQDSNLVQEVILRAISKEQTGRGNRFMVGDVKQSIYGFRQARPALFLQKYDTYEPDGEACCRIDLSRNYRSRAQVVDSVNSVFERLMSRETGGLDYDVNARLYAEMPYPATAGNESEFLLVEKPAGDNAPDPKQAEGLAIARQIKALRGSLQVTDRESGALRPLRYSDVVILLRTNQGWDEPFRKMLEEEGIPVHVTSKTGYFAATEVQELLQVLRVLDNPRQDIPLYGMLKSVFGGFSEEEIAQIRAIKRTGSLYEALCAAAGNREKAAESVVAAESGEQADPAGAGLSVKAAAFLEKLNRYRDDTVYMPIRELLQNLLEEHDYLNIVAALPAGGKRRANVEMLLNKASDFEKTSYFGLFHFVRYIELLEKHEVDYGESDMIDENADVVRIMSIHKSKGLEFPVVFVAGLAKRFNEKDATKALIAHADMGLGVTYVDPVRRVKGKTLRQQIVSCRLKEEMLAEELRILYVALTRAREKLILTACVADAAGVWGRAAAYPKERLGYQPFMSAGSFLDFLLPVMANTCFQVQIIGETELGERAAREQLDLALRRAQLQAYDAAENTFDGTQMPDGQSITADSGRGHDVHTAEEQLWERLHFIYPHQNLERLYTKTTVSELKAEAMAEKDEEAHELFASREREEYVPAFARKERQVSGTLRGSAFHRAMELLDFEAILQPCFAVFPENYAAYASVLQDPAMRIGNKARIETFLQSEKESLRLAGEYYDAIDPERIVDFLEQECAYRMWRAQRAGLLYREQPFVLGIDAKELKGRFDQDAPEGETVLIQGIIDVFWMEGDQIMLLDYKTDRIGSMQELWNRYEAQMDYYSRALNRILSKPVAERILYSTALGQEAAAE